MLKKRILKIAFVLACIVTILLPYASTVLAAALTHEVTSAELEVIRVHKGGEESSKTLDETQESLYDVTPYGYRVGDTRIFKIITKGDAKAENTFYCLDAEKSFPGVSNGEYNAEAFVNVGDLKNSTNANVKALHLSTSYANNNVSWTANYKSLIWLINNMYLANQTPEQKDDYLVKAFENSDSDIELVKALLTDDDIDVVQQYAIWYFTNGDVEKYNKETLPAVRLTRYDLDMSEEGNTVREVEGSYADFTPADFPENLSYALRQDFANELYRYLVTSAIAAKETSITYPSINYDYINANAKTVIKDGYFVTGPFRVDAGTAASTEFTIKLIDPNKNESENEIARNNYQILIDGEESFTNKNLNEIFDKDYYIYLPTTLSEITTYTLALRYSSYETKASLWKNTKTNDENVEIYQPVTLVTREDTPHSQNVNVILERQTADLALRKYIVKVNDTVLDRAPTVNTDGLKNKTSMTAEYKHLKSPVEVEVGDKIVYEIRVYNESDIQGSASYIIDSLPKGLELVENSEINNTYDWKEVEETRTNSKRYITTYLKDEVIEGFNKETNAIASKFVQIECRVTSDAVASSILTNVAEIGEDNIDDRDSAPSNNTYIRDDLDSQNYTGDRDNKKDLSDDNYYYKGIEDDDDFEKLIVKGKAFDLSLKKFITKVNQNAPSPLRIPTVDVSKLKDGTSTNANYTTVKNPVMVKKGDIVTYTLRIYNEGEIAGYAEEVADYLPEGLGFLVSHNTNIDNYWSIPDNCTTVKLKTIENGTSNLKIDDFTGVSNLDEVDVVVGKAKLTSTKLKSIETNTKNLIKEFDKENDTTLSYKDIQITCIVLADKSENNNFKNIAEIAKVSDKNRENITDRDSVPNSVDQNNYPGNDQNQDDHDFEELITEKPKEFDLSLQKFITKLNNTEITDRAPIITKNDDGTLRFNHSSDALAVCYNDLVTFTIRVYNEGDLAGYAKEVVDYLSKEGLEFVVDNETNKKFGWELYDANGNKTDKIDQAVTARTKYLSKEASEKRNENNLIKAFDDTKSVDSKNPDYRELQIVFKVTAKVTNETKDSISKREFVNKAEIYDDEDENGNSIDDKDSVPNNNKSEEDDIDSDKVYVKYFDLKLKKDLVKIVVTEDGKTREINVSGSDVLHKVEIHRKKINSTIVKFVYHITVTNEGEIAGYAEEIKDFIPEGLEFIAEENKNWTKVSDDIITTNELSKTLLEPGKSATVAVSLKWKNSEDNMGIQNNVAEISDDKNDSNTPDIDSTPNNKKDGEDDIDNAEVLITISTGAAKPKYLILAGTVLAIWATGIILIKKYVL